jgi:hypothetical protein
MVGGVPTRFVEFTDGMRVLIPQSANMFAGVVRNRVRYNVVTGEVMGSASDVPDNLRVPDSDSTSTDGGPPPLVDQSESEEEAFIDGSHGSQSSYRSTSVGDGDLHGYCPRPPQ